MAAVWPGKVHFPDVLNSKVRAWFGEKYRFLLDPALQDAVNVCMTEIIQAMLEIKPDSENIEMSRFWLQLTSYFDKNVLIH